MLQHVISEHTNDTMLQQVLYACMFGTSSRFPFRAYQFSWGFSVQVKIALAYYKRGHNLVS